MEVLNLEGALANVGLHQPLHSDGLRLSISKPNSLSIARSKSLERGDPHGASGNHHPVKIEKPHVVQGNIQHAADDGLSRVTPSLTASIVGSQRSASNGAGRMISVSQAGSGSTTTKHEIERLRQELEREKKARQEAEFKLKKTKAG